MQSRETMQKAPGPPDPGSPVATSYEATAQCHYQDTDLAKGTILIHAVCLVPTPNRNLTGACGVNECHPQPIVTSWDPEQGWAVGSLRGGAPGLAH